MAAVRYVAAVDGSLYGVAYSAGDYVDTSGWTRTQLLTQLANGTLASAYVLPSALGAALGTGGQLQQEVASGQVVLTVENRVVDLLDVDPTDLDEGMVLVYRRDTATWVPVVLSSTPALSSLSDVGVDQVTDGQSLVWSAADNRWIADDPRPAPGTAVGPFQDWTPSLFTTGTNPTMGASVIAGEWCRIGSMAEVRFAFRFASGFAPGSGAYYVTLPIPAMAGQDHTQELDTDLGSLWMSPEGSQTFFGRASISNSLGTSCALYGPSSSSGSGQTQLQATGVGGTAWTSGGLIRGTLKYHIAPGY